MVDFILVFDHTIFNDIYRTYEDGEKELQKCAKFVQDYLIIRKALVRKKLVFTSREVFERIINRTKINPKDPHIANIWVALHSLLNISDLTYTNSDVLYKDSIIILAADISFKCIEKTILLSNSSKCGDKVLTLYAKCGRPLKEISQAPFEVMNCEELIKFFRTEDKDLFKQISTMLKDNYDFL